MYSPAGPVSDKYHHAIQYMQQQQTGFPSPMSVESPGSMSFGARSPPQRMPGPRPSARRSMGEYMPPERPVNPFSRPQQPERAFPSRRNSAPPPETPWEEPREPGYRARRRSSGKRSQGSGRNYGSVKSSDRRIPAPIPSSPSRRLPRAQTFGPASTPRPPQDFDPGSPRFRYGPQSTSQHHIHRETVSETHSLGRSYDGTGKKMPMARGSKASGSLGSSSSQQFRRRSNIEGDQHIWRPRASRPPRTPRPVEHTRTPSNTSARPKLALLGFTSDDEAAYEAEISDQKVDDSDSAEDDSSASDGSKDSSDEDSSEEDEDEDEARPGENTWALTVSRTGVETISEGPEGLSENDGHDNAAAGPQKQTSLAKISDSTTSSSSEEDSTTGEDSEEESEDGVNKPLAKETKKVEDDTTDTDGNSVKVRFHRSGGNDTGDEDQHLPVITGRVSEEDDDDDDDDDDDSDEEEDSEEEESEETTSEEESEDSDEVTQQPYRQHQREQPHERDDGPEYQFGTIFESDNEESTSSDEDYDEEPHRRYGAEEAYCGSEYGGDKPTFQAYVARRRSGGGHGEEAYSRGVYDNVTPEYSYGRAWRW